MMTTEKGMTTQKEMMTTAMPKENGMGSTTEAMPTAARARPSTAKEMVTMTTKNTPTMTTEKAMSNSMMTTEKAMSTETAKPMMSTKEMSTQGMTTPSQNSNGNESLRRVANLKDAADKHAIGLEKLQKLEAEYEKYQHKWFPGKRRGVKSVKKPQRKQGKRYIGIV